MLLNAHGGNVEAVARAVSALHDEGRDVHAWSPQWAGDAHAGRIETSIMLARAPCASSGRRAGTWRRSPRAGRFVAVSSCAAVRGLPMLAAYCAAKAAVNGLVRALAVELRGTGVTANAVMPGATATAMLDESDRLHNLHAAEAFAAQQPLDRLIRPEEVAATVAWLADGATHAFTGVDGGLSA